jgi:[acyl-carrier-protein] S-malonyltransferase
MAAVLGLASEAIQAYCAEHSSAEAVVEAVNLNSPDQTVIAGHLAAVERACEALKAQGAKRALLLPVSAPFHSSLLEPAARALGQHLSGLSWSTPSVPVIHNVDVATHATADAIVHALSQQAMRPVQWVKTIQAMSAQGVTHVVECGPGKVLSGLVKRIDPALTILNIQDQASLEATLEALA